MTVIVDVPAERAAVPPHPLTGSVRWLAAAMLVAGGSLQLLEFLLEPAFASSEDRVDWWLAHGTQLELSQTFGILAIPFMLGGFWVVHVLGREHARRTVTVAVALLFSAMVGLASIHGVELAARFAAQQGDPATAIGILDVSQPGISGIATIVMFLPAAVLGNLLLAVAMWRSPYVPRLVIVLALAFAVLDFAGGLGVLGHASALASDAVLGWALVTGFVRSPRGLRPGRAD